ncbi:MAG: hypothetical protein AAGA54_06705 [Myxococcota bacterium]
MKATAALSLLLAVSTGCASTASLSSAPPLRPVPADLQVGRLAERTAFEQDDFSDGARGSSDPAPADDVRADDDEDAQRKRKAAFIAGVIASAVGGAVAIGFGAAGQVTENRLDDAYRDGLTREEEQGFQDRGEAFNGVAIGGSALAVVGLSVTAIVVGIDYTKCGSLMKKRRKECEAKQRR